LALENKLEELSIPEDDREDAKIEIGQIKRALES
jgi:hypothetical protein